MRQRDKDTKRQRDKETKIQRYKETKRQREEGKNGGKKKISRDEEIIRQRGNFKETKRTKGQRKRWIKGGEHFVFHGNTRLVCVQPTRNYL